MMQDELDALAVFETTGQAIHVAYAIMAQPATQDSMTRKSLVRMMDSMTFLPPGLNEWLEQLRGTRSATVHFDGLAPNEVRAQCAMIVNAIRTRLPKPEMWALQAKYAATEDEGRGANKRYAFSAEKAAAITSLSNWLVQTSAPFKAQDFCGPMNVPAMKELRSPFHGIPIQAMDCMVGKFYTNHKKTEISYRTLASTFGGSRMTYARAFPKIKAHLRPLEQMAIKRLTPYFEERGVVLSQIVEQEKLR